MLISCASHLLFMLQNSCRNAVPEREKENSNIMHEPLCEPCVYDDETHAHTRREINNFYIFVHRQAAAAEKTVSNCEHYSSNYSVSKKKNVRTKMMFIVYKSL